MDDHLELFFSSLQENEFEPNEANTNWTGFIQVDWQDVQTGEWKTAVHKIAIALPEGFPYQAPIVYSKDNPPLASSWHLSPGDPLTLCLWDSESGWKPHFSAKKLLNRISDWLYYFHTDTWPANSQVPDLHLYLEKIGTIIIGEDWKPPSDLTNGHLILWRSSKFSKTPYIASYQREVSVPEPRLADNIILGSNPERLRGVWFRVPQPFVPKDQLDTLFSQIDDLICTYSGWSTKKCIESIGQCVTGNGFPVAIGYPDQKGEERWLFLWSQFPGGIGKRFKWARHQKMRQVAIKSFQTAPASKEALLRRSAYISKNLTNKRIAIFGIGALGSSIALLTAKAGIGELRLVDNDNLMPGNAMRHICGLNYVGRQKTTAIKFVIHRHNPDCYVELFRATWAKEELNKYIKGCDFVIDATGNTNFSLYLNKICVDLEQPVLFTTAYRRARVGRIIMRLDRKSPCLACYLKYRAKWANDEYPIIPANPEESFIEDGCGSVTEEAVALDVEAIANFSARQTIRFLQGSHDGSNLGILVNEPLPDDDSKVLSIPGQHFWTNKAYTNCLVCG